MNNVSRNKNSSILLLIILLLALFFAIFYYVILPKKDEVDSLERSTKTIQEEIATLKGQNTVDVSTDNDVTNIYSIRQKLPQTREPDKLPLNIEEIEYLTKSRILSIDFNNYDEVVSESVIANGKEEENPESDIEEANKSEQDKENKTDEDTEKNNAKPISSISTELLPEDLKLITFSIEVQTSNYDNVNLFIEELEKLERIMHVDSIEYELLGEELEIKEDASEEVKVTIQVTTFYYEGEE